ncbi:hypothetical protein Hanom_Chr17g01553041 [Helianthus anomalus]
MKFNNFFIHITNGPLGLCNGFGSKRVLLWYALKPLKSSRPKTLFVQFKRVKCTDSPCGFMK